MADTVSVTNSGSIETWGYEGFGIFGQSTGGGGGFGGGGSATDDQDTAQSRHREVARV